LANSFVIAKIILNQLIWRVPPLRPHPLCI
jgi:hypothetical protein